MKKKIIKTVICLLAIALLILLDQLTKGWAVNNLKDKADIVLIPGAFQLHYLENSGMAFGLLKNQQTLFFIVTVVILGFALVLLYKTPENKRFFWIHLILVLLIAGAVGNFIDRTSQKYVVDFLYFSLINFPVFNVADCYVTVAGILAVILILFFYKEEELKEAFRFRKDKA